ncbi:MAG TPA: cbb3-type cytochrome c oxidase subunit I [Gammaproteobacteria bacterium]|jgi:cytochrome c oxidase subunit 1|nr:cbb3-type cytochrome c oxidase subunit I [Gammaproteobacteria bacterium]
MEYTDTYEGQRVSDAKSWITKYVFCQDHKVIAIQYSCVAMFTGIVGVILSILMRLQLGYPDVFGITAAEYYQHTTMHGMIMVIYLLTALFLGGFGNYLIPLMLGARDMAFPFVNMLSVHFFTLSVIILMGSYIVPGGPTGAGWTLYPPQVLLPGTPGYDWGIIMMILSVAVFIIAFTMGGLNYVTTVLQSRTRGMTLMRMPLVIWCIFLATVIGLLAFPALLVAGVMLLLDRVVGSSFFMPDVFQAGQHVTNVFGTEYEGGSPLLFQHLFWFFGHPEVYIVALPAFGVISELISCHARKNIFGYRMMVWALVAITAVSFIVWAHHLFVAGMNPVLGFFFATTTLIIAIPTAIKVYNWVLTLWKGDIHMTVPMLYAVGFILTFLIGGLGGLFLGNVGTDIELSDTYFVVGHFHVVMGISPVLAMCGGIHHWYPKVTGKMMNDTLGKWHFWGTFAGAYLIYIPMHYLGLAGVLRRFYDIRGLNYIPESVSDLNVFMTLTAIVVGAIQFLFLINIIWSYFKGKKADSNPWRATTLEWQTQETPPGHGNWPDKLPVVYRWPYDYSVPGAESDFIPQNVPDQSLEEPTHD